MTASVGWRSPVREVAESVVPVHEKWLTAVACHSIVRNGLPGYKTCYMLFQHAVCSLDFFVFEFTYVDLVPW